MSELFVKNISQYVVRMLIFGLIFSNTIMYSILFYKYLIYDLNNQLFMIFIYLIISLTIYLQVTILYTHTLVLTCLMILFFQNYVQKGRHMILTKPSKFLNANLNPSHSFCIHIQEHSNPYLYLTKILILCRYC